MNFLKFFIVGIISGVLLWLGLFYTLLGTPGDTTGGLYDVYQYKKQIMEETASPRIVFVGGSGTLMGIGADIIHEKLEIPTVNFGIFAGFDLDYQIQLLKPLLHQGDIVVMSYEYSAYCFSGEMSPNTRNYIVERDLDYFYLQPLNVQLEQAFTMGPGRMVEMSRSAVLPPIKRKRLYPLEKMNPFGDQTINRIEEANQEQVKRTTAFDVVKTCKAPIASWTVLENFIQSMKNERDIKFLATFPNTLKFKEYERKDFKTFMQEISDFYQKNRIPMLGSANEFTYPIELFYDSSYHLNAEGVKKRSERLAELLKDNLVVQEAQAYWKSNPST